MRLLLMLSMTVFFMAGCKHSRQEIARQPGINLFFEKTSLQKELGDCDGGGGTCAKVSLRFPIAKKGSTALIKTINNNLLSYLTRQLSLRKTGNTASMAQLDSAASAYLAEWPGILSDSENPWYFIADGEVVMQTAKVAVVFLSIRSCSGGNLPIKSITAFNFDLKTGKVMHLEDVITNMASLKIAVGNKCGKKDSDLLAATNELPGNFELRHNGIYFWRSPLQGGLSTGAGGQIGMTYEELGKLVRKDKIF